MHSTNGKFGLQLGDFLALPQECTIVSKSASAFCMISQDQLSLSSICQYCISKSAGCWAWYHNWSPKPSYVYHKCVCVGGVFLMILYLPSWRFGTFLVDINASICYDLLALIFAILQNSLFLWSQDFCFKQRHVSTCFYHFKVKRQVAEGSTGWI